MRALARRPLNAALPLALLAIAAAACSPAVDGERGLSSGQVAEAEPLRVALSAPAPGSMLAVGQTIAVAGAVEDAPGGGLTVTVNGQAVEVADDGSFAADVTAQAGLRSIDVEAQSGGGRAGRTSVAYLAGSFAGPEGAQAGGVVIRLNRPALHRLEDALAGALAHADLAQQLARNNPVLRTSGVLGSVEAHVTGASYGPAAAGLEPRPGALGATVALPDLRVDLRVDVRTLLSFSLTGRIEARRAVASAALTAWADPLGRLRVDVGAPSATFDDLTVTLDQLPFADDLVRATVRDAVEAEVQRMLREELPPQLERLLAEMTAPQGAPLPWGGTMRIDLAPQAVIHDARGLELRLAARASAPEMPFLPETPGPLLTDGAAAALPGAAGLECALSLGLFHQVLHAVWRSGAFHAPIDAEALRRIDPGAAPLDGALLRRLMPSLRELVPADAPIILRLEPLLPPVLEAEAEADGAAPLALRMGDVGIAVYAAVADGLPVPVVQGRAQLALPARLATEDAAVRLTFDAEGQAVAAEVTGSLEDVPVADAELAALARELLPGILAAASAPGGGVRLPQPVVGGQRLTAAGLSVTYPGASPAPAIVIAGEYR